MTAEDAMTRINELLTHVWMVRTFLKHCDEAEQDEELREIQRTLYDYMLSLGGPFQARDAVAYLKQARKKFPKLTRACELLIQIQPEVSTHTNFQMAAESLRVSVAEIGNILERI
jgi:cob(I)alamin adenosyltransferase